MRTEKSPAAYSSGAGVPGSTTAPPRGTCTPKSSRAQFTTRNCCGAARCSTTRCRRPGGSHRTSGTLPRWSGVIASCTTTWMFHGLRPASLSSLRTALSSSGRVLIPRSRSPVAMSRSHVTSGSSGQNTVAGEGQAGSQASSASASSVHSCPPAEAGSRISLARTVTSPGARQRASKIRGPGAPAVPGSAAGSSGGSRKSSTTWSSLSRSSVCRTVSSAAEPTWRPRAAHSVGGYVGRAVGEVGMGPSGSRGTDVGKYCRRRSAESTGGCADRACRGAAHLRPTGPRVRGGRGWAGSNPTDRTARQGAT